MEEFDLIGRYLTPLAAEFPGALSLTDDAALLTPPAGQQLVVTKDAIAEGVHYLGQENPALIARKLLRTNLSDLAAMGATPYCYFLALALPAAEESWIARFAAGLAEDQAHFGLHLAGGDTIRAPHAVLSLTAIGTVPTGQALRRNGARVDDAIYVSGTLGDSTLGLAKLRSGGSAQDWLIDRYLLPQPRLELGQSLRGLATACMDISDGLAQDLEHLCRASGVGALVNAAALPLSDAAKDEGISLESALTGGDDYELLFTVPKAREAAVHSLGTPVTRIGVCTLSSGVRIVDGAGTAINLGYSGYRHFS